MSLRSKLFVIFVSISAVILLAIYVLNRSQFERGFSEVKRQHEARFTRMLVQRVESLYARDRSWLMVQSNPELWLEWMDMRPTPPPPPAAPVNNRHQRDHRPLHGPEFHSPPVWLLSTEKKVLAGPPDLPDLIKTPAQALYDRDELIGYLVIDFRHDRVLAAEAQFEQAMLRQLSISGGLALVLSAVLAYALAFWLGRRVNALRSGANILRDGDYAYRLDARSGDEFGDLARDFNALAAHLDQLHKQRENAFAELAHELRTPIAVMRAEIEALQVGIRSPSPTAFESLLTEVAHLTRLVDDINVLNRADAGVLVLHKSKFDWVSLTQEVASVHATAIAQHALQWQLQAPTTVIVQADQRRCRQILHNLFENAVRYCDHGAQVRLTVTVTDAMLRLAWEDSGPGVDVNDLPHLFERFYRGAGRMANEGSGLGLAIVRAIVLAHGGQLSARASALGGLAILIEMPL